MESNSSSVSCIHMLCMCSLLSTSFKFSLCGCMFYTFSMFVALSCAFFRKILLFISKAAVSSSDALQTFSKTPYLSPSLFHVVVQQPLPLFGLHCESWAPWGTISASPLLCLEVVSILLVFAMMFAPFKIYTPRQNDLNMVTSLPTQHLFIF